MLEQHVKAGEVDKAEGVLDVVFPSGDESAEAVRSSGSESYPGRDRFPSSEEVRLVEWYKGA
jgi:hypothetical protein